MRTRRYAHLLARLCLALPCAAGLSLSGAGLVHAYDEGTFGEIETKYIFGFTEGSNNLTRSSKKVTLIGVISFAIIFGMTPPPTPFCDSIADAGNVAFPLIAG